MLIGSDNIDYNKITSMINDIPGIIAYVESMIPAYARHLPYIVMNQRYYVAIHIRDMLHIPYKVRMEAASALISGITIFGVITSFTPIKTLFECVDANVLIKMLQEHFDGKI